MSNLIEMIGSTFRRSKVGVGNIDYAAGTVKGIEIPNSLLIKGLTLRLTGSVTVGSNAATIFSDAPLGLLKNIQVIGDGRRELFNASAKRLFRIAHFAWGKQNELTSPSGSVGTTNTFAATICLDHEMIQAVNPVETLFDPRLYKLVKLNVLWGSVTDIGSAATNGTLTLNSATLSVMADQTADGVEQILGDHVVIQDEQPVTASTSRFTFKVPQNGLLAGVMLDTTRDSGATPSTGPIPVDNIINKVSIKSDQTVAHYDNAAWADLQREFLQKYQVDTGGPGTTFGQPITGFCYLPFIENGMLSSCLNTNALNNLLITLDVTSGSGTQIVGVTYDFIEPRRTLAASVA